MIVKCCEENVKNDVLEGQPSASKQQWLLRDPAFIVYNLSGETASSFSAFVGNNYHFHLSNSKLKILFLISII